MKPNTFYRGVSSKLRQSAFERKGGGPLPWNWNFSAEATASLQSTGEHFHLNLLKLHHSCWTTGFPNKPSCPSEKVRTVHPSNAGSYDDGVQNRFQDATAVVHVVHGELVIKGCCT